ncbi:MAG: TldD/PmbA family protein [Candidatus Bathyarchaeia archaeon]
MDRSKLVSLLYNRCLDAGVDEVSVVVTQERARMTRFSENQITVSKTWNTTRAMAYLIKDHKRMAFLLENLSQAKIREAVRRALAWMERAKAPKIKVSLPEGPFDYGCVEKSYDSRVSGIGDRMPDMVDAAINGALSEKARKAAGVLKANEHYRLIKTSRGCEGTEKGTYLEFTIRAFYQEDSSGHENWCGSTVEGFNPEALGAAAGRTAYEAKEPHEGRPGLYDAILGPSVMGDLLNSVALFSSASMVEVGLSCLDGKVGKKVSSENLTLIDDPRIPASPGITLFDDEGYPTEKVEIIKEGVLQTLLHSSYTAKKSGGRLTGNAYYSLFGEVSPVPRCLTTGQGDWGLDEMVHELGEGLLVTNSWYTRFHNYLTGDFSTIPRDAVFNIKGGEVAGSVSGLRISDNLLSILASIRALSKERVWRRWWEIETPILLPSFLVKGLRFTKSTL